MLSTVSSHMKGVMSSKVFQGLLSQKKKKKKNGCLSSNTMRLLKLLMICLKLTSISQKPEILIFIGQSNAVLSLSLGMFNKYVLICSLKNVIYEQSEANL